MRKFVFLKDLILLSQYVIIKTFTGLRNLYNNENDITSRNKKLKMGHVMHFYNRFERQSPLTINNSNLKPQLKN